MATYVTSGTEEVSMHLIDESGDEMHLIAAGQA
jgi:hypothetical protein